ncbi:MAG: sigma-70 family RNA polymerase sigma factor [Phycisphaerales bacterium]|nr:sigma-70 family RNA polymerase sigma factor [Phycisphaerales bacterium]
MTRLLDLARGGDESARQALWDRVYQELHRTAEACMRRERPAHTLQTTAVVHEAYFKLFNRSCEDYRSAGHFFSAAANAMRQILVDHARKKRATKRGGGAGAVPLDGDGFAAEFDRDPETELAVSEAMHLLEKEHPRAAEVAKLRYYTGLTVRQTAEALGVGDRTVEADWKFARAWLYQRLGGE